MEPPQPQGLTWRDLRREAATSLSKCLGEDRQQEARWLVERVSGYSSTELLINDNVFVSTRSVAFFDSLLIRRCNGEPLQYVLGQWSFRSLDLVIGPGVLIPRPETEMVAGLAIAAASEAALEAAAKIPLAKPIAVDLGTGSGAIALSLAVEVPGLLIWATDASADALAIARANLAGLGRSASRVTMVEGDWFLALPRELCGHINVLVSNPPYVAESMRSTIADDVLRYEPHQALFSGVEGTDDLARIINGAPTWLAPDGVLVLEMSPEQTLWASNRAKEVGLVDVKIHDDFTARPRALSARKASAL